MSALLDLAAVAFGLWALPRFVVGPPLEAPPFGQPYAGQFRLTSPYGPRYHPIQKRDMPHKGLDLGLPLGTSVIPIAAGLVSRIVRDTPSHGMGNAVYVDHGAGWQSRYLHLSQIRVARGQHVDRNDVLGLSGATGGATGPHLHLEIRQHDPQTGRFEPVDPTPLIRWA